MKICDIKKNSKIILKFDDKGSKISTMKFDYFKNKDIICNMIKDYFRSIGWSIPGVYIHAISDLINIINQISISFKFKIIQKCK